MLHATGTQRFRRFGKFRVGTVPTGEIVYLQDNYRPFAGFRFPIVRRAPWIVESYRGTMAQVRCLRTGRRQDVQEWYILAHVDAGI